MNRTTKLTITLAAVLFLFGLAYITRSNVETVAVRTWITDTNSGAPLPEMADAELAVPWLKDRASFGIAFSGGGIRSASAPLGQLRALHSLGWLDRARYISANSGVRSSLEIISQSRIDAIITCCPSIRLWLIIPTAVK